MSKLKAALAWASRGFRVFPIAPNKKAVFVDFAKNWTECATTDPDTIRGWWTNNRGGEIDYNIGCCTTGLIVADIDVKEGKRGLESFESLGLSMSSLTVKTPSGGYHVYYDGPESACAKEILGPGSGLDIRAFHGFVLAPGSSIDGILYEVYVEADIEQVPYDLFDILKSPRIRGTREKAPCNDSESNIADGIFYLQNGAPIAVEGEGGNSTTYAVAAKLVNDFALSEDTALDILLEHWNDRCLPPWSERELLYIVEHAETYSTGIRGSATAEYIFGDDFEDTVQSKPEDSIEGIFEGILDDIGDSKPVDESRFKFDNYVPLDELLAREWTYCPILMRKQITQVTATGAGGKSSFALLMAVHGALGLDFLGYKLHDGPFKSIIYNAEDDIQEQTRRLAAICNFFDFDIEEVGKRVMLLSAEDFDPDFSLTLDSEGYPNKPLIRKLVKFCMDPEVALLCLDPFVMLHSVEENDNTRVTLVMRILRKIAIWSDISILLGHHVSKPGNSRTPGDVNAGRGASAIATSCRINLMLSGMSVEEAEQYGISEDDRFRYIRLDDTKMNYASRNARAKWMKLHSIDVPGKGRLGDIKLDSVGVLRLHDLNSEAAASAIQMGETIRAEFINASTSSASVIDTVNYVITGDPGFYGGAAPGTVRSRIENALRRPIVLSDGATIRLDKIGNTKTVILE